MDEDEAQARERERILIEEQVALKEAELEALQNMSAEAGFRPRASLARTPPSGFSASTEQLATTQQGETAAQKKRPLSSPEEVSEQVRRRIGGGSRKTNPPPPVGGILTGSAAHEPSIANAPPAGNGNRTDTATLGGLANLSKEDLLDKVHGALKGIATIAGGHNKLNIADKGAISAHSQDILVTVAALELRLADMEHAVTAAKLGCASAELKMATYANVDRQPGLAPAPPSKPSYAETLRLPRGHPEVPLAADRGPTVIFYPKSDTVKTAEDTLKELHTTVQPGPQKIAIQAVRKIGNAGVVVRTTTAAAAAKLKEMAPPTLRATDPRQKRPLVALRGLRADPPIDILLRDLHAVNMEEDAEWPLDRLKAEAKMAFKRGRLEEGRRLTVVLECTAALRSKLVNLGTAYIGWDEVEIVDHLKITCCRRCQQYGHPERYCKAKEVVCANCGATGHKESDCKSETRCCATCKRFKRKDADTHTTAAAACPARLHAEQQAAYNTDYGRT